MTACTIRKNKTETYSYGDVKHYKTLNKEVLRRVTLRLLFSAASNVSDFSNFEKVSTRSNVPEHVISTDKCSIKIPKIAKIGCR